MQKKPHILVADDEPSIRLTLEAGLSLKGFRVTCARTGHEALEAARVTHFDAVVSDIYMPDGDGLEVVRELRQSTSPEIPIILITAQGSLELAVRAVEEGASDFIAKPFEIAELSALLRRHLHARREAASEAAEDSSAPPQDFSRSGLVGRSPAMIAVYKRVAYAARTDATVLILGESGTGKELVASNIHNFSARAQKPFIAVNCSGLTDTLLESELFGHIKGAFTGASSDRPGLFEAAEGGTLFLDELASTSAAFQVSLLRVLQSKEVRRVGSIEARRIDVRVIGASNAPLRDLAAAGSFRPDLFYRLSVLTIDLPPLRDRLSDIELLARHFLSRAEEAAGTPLHLSKDAAAALRKYEFLGNVRELENALTSAAALSANGLITLDNLPKCIAGASSSSSVLPPAVEAAYALIADQPTMEVLQSRYLQLVLQQVEGNRHRAAKVLGLNRRTVQRLIARYSLEAHAEPESDASAEANSEPDDDLNPERTDTI
ncbi:MAG: sigma-54-dependent transcriptional regulator [Pyrinomonadaceae bacterium]